MMGVVNLFGDMTYEGGARINGPFLGTLGASAAAISIIAGLSEFLGYSLRSVSGYIADRTGKHWSITFVGYSINLLAVPAMALETGWQLAAGFILAECIGRAIRKPTVEAMLSYSTGKSGKGWVYAVNTAMDEDFVMVATRLRDTAFKRVLRNLPPGTEVSVEDPFGDLKLYNDNSRTAVVVTGGIGITPFRRVVVVLFLFGGGGGYYYSRRGR